MQPAIQHAEAYEFSHFVSMAETAPGDTAKPELKIEYLWSAFGGSIMLVTHCHKSDANMI
jgi:hypothetical protein